MIHHESTFIKAIEKYGEEAQLVKAMEECGELCAAISHWMSGKIKKSELASEMADVYNMLYQIQMISGITEHNILQESEKKVTRLRKKLEES